MIRHFWGLELNIPFSKNTDSDGKPWLFPVKMINFHREVSTSVLAAGRYSSLFELDPYTSICSKTWTYYSTVSEAHPIFTHNSPTLGTATLEFSQVTCAFQLVSGTLSIDNSYIYIYMCIIIYIYYK